MLHPVIASREVTRYILDTFGLHTKKTLWTELPHQ